MTTPPYPFQLRGVRQLHRMGGRCLLADEQGLGKTLSSLLYAVRHPELRPIIVVCPASVKFVWEREAAFHFGIRAEVLQGTRGQEGNILIPATLVVINYDIIWPWMEYLRGLKPKLVILDECQAISSRYTKRTKGVHELCKGVPQVLALSGTPLTNRPAELFPTLNLLRPDLFPSFFPFGIRYCGGRRAPWGFEFKGATNLEELHKIMSKNLMVRRKKEDVLKELPGKTRGVIPLEVTNYKEYQHALNDFLGWLLEHQPERVARAERAQRLVKIGYLLRLAGWLKLPNVIKWVDAFLKESDRKLVLFAVHKSVIQQLRKEYQGLSVVVDGSTSLKDRKLAVDQFQHQKQARIFIGNIKAAGKGLTLTAASDVAFAELDWTPGAHLQAEDRIHRIGTVNPSFIHYLIAKDTIEAYLVELIQKKQGVLSVTLDGGGTNTDLDIFDRLIEKLTKDKST